MPDGSGGAVRSLHEAPLSSAFRQAWLKWSQDWQDLPKDSDPAVLVSRVVEFSGRSAQRLWRVAFATVGDAATEQVKALVYAFVALVDETFALRHFGGNQAALGRRFRFPGENFGENPMWHEIVGVVGNIRHQLDREYKANRREIPPDLLPRVFDRFFRVPGSGANGSGLGLAIAQAAAQRAGLLLTLRNRQDRSGLIARIEPMAEDSLPDMRARSRPGTAMAAMMPMIATTISSSIRVKPF